MIFFSFSSSTVGRKLSFRSRYRFFSSFCFFSSAGDWPMRTNAGKKSRENRHWSELLTMGQTKDILLLFRMFLSISSSGVGLIDKRRMSRAPIASFDSCRSFSDCICNIFLLINSSTFGRMASFSESDSFRAILAWRCSGTASSRYKIGPSDWSLSLSWSRIPYGWAFSLFSTVDGNPMVKRIGRLL